MNTPNQATQEQVQAPYSVDYLQQLKAITEDQKMAAFYQATAKKFEFQTAMLRILDEAKATEWVDQLHEDNQKQREQREAHETEKAEVWERLKARFETKEPANQEQPERQESVDISEQQPAESVETGTGNQAEQQPEQKAA